MLKYNSLTLNQWNDKVSKITYKLYPPRCDVLASNLILSIQYHFLGVFSGPSLVDDFGTNSQ